MLDQYVEHPAGALSGGALASRRGSRAVPVPGPLGLGEGALVARGRGCCGGRSRCELPVVSRVSSVRLRVIGGAYGAPPGSMSR